MHCSAGNGEATKSLTSIVQRRDLVTVDARGIKLTKTGRPTPQHNLMHLAPPSLQPVRQSKSAETSRSITFGRNLFLDDSRAGTCFGILALALRCFMEGVRLADLTRAWLTQIIKRRSSVPNRCLGVCLAVRLLRAFLDFDSTSLFLHRRILSFASSIDLVAAGLLRQ